MDFNKILLLPSLPRNKAIENSKHVPATPKWQCDKLSEYLLWSLCICLVFNLIIIFNIVESLPVSWGSFLLLPDFLPHLTVVVCKLRPEVDVTCHHYSPPYFLRQSHSRTAY